MLTSPFGLGLGGLANGTLMTVGNNALLFILTTDTTRKEIPLHFHSWSPPSRLTLHASPDRILLQPLLSRNKRPVQHSPLVRPGHVPVHGQVLVQEGQQLQTARGVAPVAHEVHDDGEEPLQDDAGLLHAAVGVVGEALGEGAAGFGVGEDGVAFGAEGEGEEFGACGSCMSVVWGFGEEGAG